MSQFLKVGMCLVAVTFVEFTQVGLKESLISPFSIRGCAFDVLASQRSVVN